MATKNDLINIIETLDVNNITKIYDFTSKLNNEKIDNGKTNKVTVETKEKIDNVKINNNVIDKTTDKYKVLLKFTNRILENIGKSQITDMTEFKNIDRIDIVKDANKQILLSMENELFKMFDKKKCGYYTKSNNIVLNVFKRMCKDIGLSWHIHKTSLSKNNYVKYHSFYTIIE